MIEVRIDRRRDGTWWATRTEEWREPGPQDSDASGPVPGRPGVVMLPEDGPVGWDSVLHMPIVPMRRMRSTTAVPVTADDLAAAMLPADMIVVYGLPDSPVIWSLGAADRGAADLDALPEFIRATVAQIEAVRHG